MVRIPRDFNRRRPTAAVISDRVRTEVSRSGRLAAETFQEIGQGSAQQGKLTADLANFVGNKFMASLENDVDLVQPADANRYIQEKVTQVPEQVQPLAAQYALNRISQNPAQQELPDLRSGIYESVNDLLDRSYQDGRDGANSLDKRALQLTMLLDGMDDYITPTERKAFETLIEKKYLEGHAVTDVVDLVNLRGIDFSDELIDQVIDEQFPEITRNMHVMDVLDQQQQEQQKQKNFEQRITSIDEFLQTGNTVLISEEDLNAIIQKDDRPNAVKEAFLSYYAEDEMLPAEHFAEQFNLKGSDLSTYVKLIENSDLYGPILRDIPNNLFPKGDMIKLYDDIIKHEGQNVDKLINTRKQLVRQRELPGIKNIQEFNQKLKTFSTFEDRVAFAAKRKYLDE